MFPPAQNPRRGAPIGRAALLVVALAGCRSNTVPDSVWPPSDFRLRVHVEDGAGAPARHRSFLVFADGLAVYREAESTLDPDRLPVPVYRTVAVYRLDPRTTRSLARELERAGLLQPPEPTEVNRPQAGDDAWVAWWGHGQSGHASRRQLDRGPLDRALEICDAYLPPSRSFTGGAPDTHRVAEVPEPLTDTRGALRAHVEIVQQRAVDADFLREVFALAIAAGEPDIAADALREIVALGPVGPDGELLAEDEWERFELQPMRDVLRDAEGG